MEEAAEADYIVVIDSGKIAAKGTPLELKNAYVEDYIIIYGAEERDVSALGVKYEAFRGGVKLSVPNTAKATELILSNTSLFRDYEVIKGKIDDVFLAVTGKKAGGDE
jgi:multidrug/hemolysin transport system ATP-binding protein